MTSEEFFKKHPSLEGKAMESEITPPAFLPNDIARTQTDNAILKEKIDSLLCFIYAKGDIQNREEIDKYIVSFFKTLEKDVPHVVLVDDLKRALKKWDGHQCSEMYVLKELGLDGDG